MGTLLEMCPACQHHPSCMLRQKTFGNCYTQGLSTWHGQNCMALCHLLTHKGSIFLFFCSLEHYVKQTHTQKGIFKSFSGQSSIPGQHDLTVKQAQEIALMSMQFSSLSFSYSACVCVCVHVCLCVHMNGWLIGCLFSVKRITRSVNHRHNHV